LSQINLLELSDFWWLSENEIEDELFTGMGHHAPLADSDDPLPLNAWFHSLSENMQLSCTYELYPLDFLTKWRSVCNNTNVYRTLKIFTSNQGVARFLGPFLVDIDSSNWKDGYEENLGDALDVARKVVHFLIVDWGLRAGDIRIFFSGRKGFNIEIRPQALGIVGSVADQLMLSAKKRQEIVEQLDVCNNTISSAGTRIDPVYGDRFNNYELKHPYIRLHDSWNKWARNNGITCARRKIEISLDKLFDSTVDEICARAEEPG